jgi:hypothetical protein
LNSYVRSSVVISTIYSQMASKYVKRSEIEKSHREKINALEYDKIRRMTKKQILDFLHDEFYLDERQERLRTFWLKSLNRKRTTFNDESLPPRPTIILLGGIFHIRYYDHLKQYTIKRSLNIPFQKNGEENVVFDFNDPFAWKNHPKALQLEFELLQQYAKNIDVKIFIRAMYDIASKNLPLYTTRPNGSIVNLNLNAWISALYSTEIEEKEIEEVNRRSLYLMSKITLMEAYRDSETVWVDIMPEYTPYNTSKFIRTKQRLINLLRKTDVVPKKKRKSNANKKVR